MFLKVSIDYLHQVIGKRQACVRQERIDGLDEFPRRTRKRSAFNNKQATSM